ncbi:MAG: hypothetical protein RUMPE_00702 [Eubacteriales bacterium SKADARSKE-1]|nr:hypothetical protein [Eubacteriales bacterium SKADARSKE-1]
MDKDGIKKKIDSMNVEELREIAGGWPIFKDAYTFEDY